MTGAERPHRPARRADLAPLADALSARDVYDPGAPFARSEIATATAVAVITHGRSAGGRSLVDLADRVGLDTLAELWQEEDPSSLPGALWALYLLRRWCRSNAQDVTRLWTAGRAYAPADEIVAGVADDLDPAAVGRLADAILTGAYEGDFAVALERAAAFFRVVSEGRRQLADYAEDRGSQLALADRNAAVAASLAVAAERWRRDPLR